MVKRIKNGKAKKIAKTAEKDLKRKIGLFNKIPQQCTNCQDFFDKTDIDMVMSWHVVVRNEDVRLYCKECWEWAKETVAEFKRRTEERQDVSGSTDIQ